MIDSLTCDNCVSTDAASTDLTVTSPEAVAAYFKDNRLLATGAAKYNLWTLKELTMLNEHGLHLKSADLADLIDKEGDGAGIRRTPGVVAQLGKFRAFAAENGFPVRYRHDRRKVRTAADRRAERCRYRSWTPAEDRILIEGCERGDSYADLGSRLGRSEKALINRFSLLAKKSAGGAPAVPIRESQFTESILPAAGVAPTADKSIKRAPASLEEMLGVLSGSLDDALRHHCNAIVSATIRDQVLTPGDAATFVVMANELSHQISTPLRQGLK